MNDTAIENSGTERALWAILWLFLLIPRAIWYLIELATVDLPTILVAQFMGLLNLRLDITLNVSSLLLLLGGMVTMIWMVVRYRYLTKYSRLPPEVPRQELKMDLLVDSDSESERKTGMTSYLDDVSDVAICVYICF
jgi:hypothetical protein